MQHTTSHTTAEQSPSISLSMIYPFGEQWYQLPEFIPSNLHSTCHLNNKTYLLTRDLHCHRYLHLRILYQLLDSCNLYKQMTSSLCTCYPIYHCISCVPTVYPLVTTSILYNQRFYYRHHMAILQPSPLPSALIITLVLFIFTLFYSACAKITCIFMYDTLAQT